MKMYRGDLKPDLTITCTDDEAPVNLTTATAIRVIGVRNGTVVFDRAGTGTAEGVVTMAWQAEDTATAGHIQVEAEVMWPGNKPQTFRPAGVVEIVPDLG